MLKREELTSRAHRPDRRGRPQGRLRLLPVGRGARGEPQAGAGALRARRGGVGLRLRLADVESGASSSPSAALHGRGLAPLLLLLDADGPRHARAARPDAGARARRRVRGHRLSPGAGPGARASSAILWNREMLAGVYQAALGADRSCATAAPSPPSPSWSTPRTASIAATCRSSGQAHHIAFAEGRRGACRDYLANTAAHARALGIHDPYIEELVERVADLRGGSLRHPDGAARRRGGRRGLESRRTKTSPGVRHCTSP